MAPGQLAFNLRLVLCLVTLLQVGRLERTRADILLALIQDPPTTAGKLMGLRDLMPGVNISLLVSRW